MRNLVFGAAVLAAITASPALARDGSVYIELDHAIAGAMKVNDLKIDVGTTPNAAQAYHQPGYEIGGAVGYDFGMFRVEGEVSWRKSDAESLVSVVRIPDNTSLNATSPLGTFMTEFSDVKAGTLMLNGMLDVGKDDSIQFYAGGGVGLAQVKARYSINRLGPGWINDSDSSFAWQGIVGVRYPVGSRVDLGLKARYLSIGTSEFVDTGSRAVATRYRTKSLMFTVGYNF